MSHQTIDLLYAVTGQSLYFDAPEGRASSVTSSTVYENASGDDGATEAATTGSAAVETNPNTTTDGDAGPGALDEEREVSLTSATGVAVDREYLLTNEDGAAERVLVQAIDSTNVVTLRNPLQVFHAAGATFQSTRITHAVDSTWIAASANISNEFDPNPRYRWRLVYVVASVAYAHDLYFDVLRYAGRHDVSPIDVDRRSPGWLERLGTNDRLAQGRVIIDEAYQVIKFDLYNLSTPDQSIRNREVVNELVKLKAIELVDNTDASAKRYESRLAQLIANAKVVTSKDSTGAASPADPHPIWRR